MAEYAALLRPATPGAVRLRFGVFLADFDGFSMLFLMVFCAPLGRSPLRTVAVRVVLLQAPKALCRYSKPGG